MRGKVCCPPAHVMLSGITPAYAGKSAFGLLSSAGSGDHPRVCGEKLTGSAFTLNGLGSPPRMRGKVQIPEYIGGQRRITPAYAGKSLKETYNAKS